MVALLSCEHTDTRKVAGNSHIFADRYSASELLASATGGEISCLEYRFMYVVRFAQSFSNTFTSKPVVWFHLRYFIPFSSATTIQMSSLAFNLERTMLLYIYICTIYASALVNMFIVLQLHTARSQSTVDQTVGWPATCALYVRYVYVYFVLYTDIRCDHHVYRMAFSIACLCNVHAMRALDDTKML